MMKRILFVCLGNICRSPAAEALVRDKCPEIETDSAGTSDFHTGAPPYGPMQAAAKKRSINMSDLRARKFTSEDFLKFDFIIVMDGENQRNVEDLRPSGNTTPVELFAPMAPGHVAQDVPDPYYTRDFDGCLDLLEAAATGLQRRILGAG
ncbi:low molecular weight protein-tyrosine-phosphatase [Tritonibacter scottomollicae]|nr:low molecular weight protein-tyrosine-phosphatase [Tritonibacter scottomollicae]